MRLHRFYTTERLERYATGSGKNPGDVSGGFALPDHALAHQLRSVFRLRSGAQVILFDGSGIDYTAEIVSFGKDEVMFRIVGTQIVKQAAKHRLALVFSLIKKDNVEWVIEKCTELGVSEFIPVISERSEKKGFNMERAQKKMIEACEQSGRSEIATIHEPVELVDFIAELKTRSKTKEQMIVFHTEGKSFGRSMVKDSGDEDINNDIIACVGPEGGWTEKEITQFAAAGALIAKLDTPVLRAETASVAVATLILA